MREIYNITSYRVLYITHVKSTTQAMARRIHLFLCLLAKTTSPIFSPGLGVRDGAVFCNCEDLTDLRYQTMHLAHCTRGFIEGAMLQ